jgi:hypothetical protein
MAQTCRLRLVVANDLRSYREAIATAIQRLLPDVEVMVVDPRSKAIVPKRWCSSSSWKRCYAHDAGPGRLLRPRRWPHASRRPKALAPRIAQAQALP